MANNLIRAIVAYFQDLLNTEESESTRECLQWIIDELKLTYNTDEDYLSPDPSLSLKVMFDMADLCFNNPPSYRIQVILDYLNELQNSDGSSSIKESLEGIVECIEITYGLKKKDSALTNSMSSSLNELFNIASSFFCKMQNLPKKENCASSKKEETIQISSDVKEIEPEEIGKVNRFSSQNQDTYEVTLPEMLQESWEETVEPPEDFVYGDENIPKEEVPLEIPDQISGVNQEQVEPHEEVLQEGQDEKTNQDLSPDFIPDPESSITKVSEELRRLPFQVRCPHCLRMLVVIEEGTGRNIYRLRSGRWVYTRD